MMRHLRTNKLSFNLNDSTPAVRDLSFLVTPILFPILTDVPCIRILLLPSMFFFTKFEVTQNYPNPFNPVTAIGYALPVKGKVQIDVYNSLGEKVITLADEVKEAGTYTASFNGSRYSSGVYFYRVIFNGQAITKRMMMVK